MGKLVADMSEAEILAQRARAERLRLAKREAKVQAAEKAAAAHRALLNSLPSIDEVLAPVSGPKPFPGAAPSYVIDSSGQFRLPTTAEIEVQRRQNRRQPIPQAVNPSNASHGQQSIAGAHVNRYRPIEPKPETLGQYLAGKIASAAYLRAAGFGRLARFQPQ